MLNVPFLYDSTPKWSERGKLRDILIPSVTNFNPNIIDNLLEYSTEISDMFYLIDNEIERLSITYEDNKILVGGNIHNNKIFLETTFKKININISNKSLDHLITNYPNFYKNNTKYTLSKSEYIRFINENMFEVII